jgi:putative DNA primase/helicase
MSSDSSSNKAFPHESRPIDERVKRVLEKLEEYKDPLGKTLDVLKEKFLSDFSIYEDNFGLILSCQGFSRRCIDPVSLLSELELLMRDVGLDKELGRAETQRASFYLEKAIIKALREEEEGEGEERGERLAFRLGISCETAKGLLDLKNYKRLSERLTIATGLLVEAAIERFKYLKNYMAREGVDLGIHYWDGWRWTPFEKQLEQWLEGIYSRLGLESLGIRYKPLREEVEARLLDKLREPLTYEPSAIAFKNCIFDWEALRPESPSPEKMAFHYINHQVDLDLLEELLKSDEITGDLVLERAPKTLSVFGEWVGDKWLLLFEIMGFLLYPKPYKKAVLLIDVEGKCGDTGKSSFIRYLQKILGHENYCSIPPQMLADIEEHKHTLSQMYRKLANFYADLPDVPIKNVGQLKVLTGGDTILIEPKFKPPFTWLPYTKHIFSSNRPPMVKKADEAFWKRWLVVEFVGNFKERVADFEGLYKAMLQDEVDKAIAIAIVAFRNVLLRGSFSYENTPEDAKNKWLARSDSIYAFLLEFKEGGALVEDKWARVEVSEVYRYYARYCELNDMEPVEQNVFTRRLKELGFTIKRPKNISTIYGYKLDVGKAEELLKGESKEEEEEGEVVKATREYREPNWWEEVH